MKKEKLIIKVPLKDAFSSVFISDLAIKGFKKTGRKFSISFNGSKGYLDHLEIEACGIQKENNRINLFCSNTNYILSVFYSDSFGIRLSLCPGGDKPRNLKIFQKILDKRAIIQNRLCNSNENDLPL